MKALRNPGILLHDHGKCSQELSFTISSDQSCSLIPNAHSISFLCDLSAWCSCAGSINEYSCSGLIVAIMHGCCAVYKDDAEMGSLERRSLPPSEHKYADRGNADFLAAVEDRRAIKASLHPLIVA